MTGKPAAPIACTVCGTAFEPRRSDAKFCSSKCRQAGHRRRKTDNPLKTNLRVAKNLYAADELFKLYRHGAMTLRAYAELDGDEGLVFEPTRRGIVTREHIPGAARSAIRRNNRVAKFLRGLFRDGYDSKDPRIIRALERRGDEANARGFEAHLKRQDRHAQAEWDRQERARDGGKTRRARRIVKGCGPKPLRTNYPKLSRGIASRRRKTKK